MRNRPKPAAPALARSQEPWLLAAAVATLAPHAAYAPAWLSVAAGVGLAWRSALWWFRWPLPPRWLLTVLVVVGSIGVYATYRQLFGKDPGVALLILFLALKLLEMRHHRDALAVVFLCLFLMLTHFLNAQEIEVAGLTLTALLILTASLASLHRPGQRAAANLRLAAIMLAQATPFMLVLFVLFPRIEGPLWGLPVDAYSGLTGLSDSMTPGSISTLSQSSAIAFRAHFEGGTPPRSALYWRGPVLRSFDGRTWRIGPEPLLSAPPDRLTAPAVNYTVTLEPHNRTWLFALELPAVVPSDANLTGDYQLRARRPVRTRLRYEMRSVLAHAAGSDLPPEALRPFLLLPRDFNPRARALGAEWRRAPGADDETIVQRMLTHLREQPFAYTLNPPLLGADGIDEFLFDTRRGFCEHFAAAFVVVMRAAGIPARVVTGYQGGEANPIDGYLIVRQSDAHAWAEVWLKGRGWVRVDPTAAIAPSRIESGLAAAVPAGEALPFGARVELTWLRDLRFRWEAVSNAWNQWVLGYNPERQREVLSRLGMRKPDWRSMTAAMTALCGALMLGLTLWAIRRRVRVDPALAAWNRLSGKLARIGLARHAWEGPLDYARRAGRAVPALAEPLARIASLYAALRYGPATTPAPVAELNRLIAQLDIRDARR